MSAKTMQIKARVPEWLVRKITDAAAEKGRTFSAEMRIRLFASFGVRYGFLDPDGSFVDEDEV